MKILIVAGVVVGMGLFCYFLGKFCGFNDAMPFTDTTPRDEQ